MAVARLPFDCWRLTGLYASCWNWWRLLYFGGLFLQRSHLHSALLQCWCFTFLRCTVADNKDTSSYNSPIRTYVDNYYSLCVSHDADRSDPKDLCSLGVVDLDLAISPDAFGLRAFDVSIKLLTRMLPGSSLCELRLMIPDLGIAPEGFHDVLIENLAASLTWQSRHISPGDVTLLRRRWPKAVFRTMRRRSKEVERLRRFSRRRPEWAFRHSKPRFCSICHEQIASALDVNMMIVHLELGQLWRCPVEWCGIWKGSVSDCLGHLQDKHAGSQYVTLKNMAKFFPSWTLPRDLWLTALHPDISGIAVDVRLFHGAGCRLVHKYRTYEDPFSHPALRGGGGGVLPRLLSFVARAMAIAQLTHLHISIPASGAPPGEVPEECFLRSTPSRGPTDPRRVSFASGVTVLGGDPPLEQSPDIQIHDPVCPDITEEGEMDIMSAEPDVPNPILRLPPDFRQFSWPWEAYGGRTVIRLCFHRRCRFRQSFRLTWTTRLLPMWSRPGMSRTLRPRPLSPHRLSWRLFRLRWISDLTSWWTRRRPMFTDRSRCHLRELSPISRTI